MSENYSEECVKLLISLSDRHELRMDALEAKLIPLEMKLRLTYQVVKSMDEKLDEILKINKQSN